jgi:Domain of unknown function (DUF4177)
MTCSTGFSAGFVSGSEPFRDQDINGGLAVGRFEYKFVKIDISTKLPVVTQYLRVITEHAEQGWRLVQVVVPESPLGRPLYVDIILEKTKETAMPST